MYRNSNERMRDILSLYNYALLNALLRDYWPWYTETWLSHNLSIADILYADTVAKINHIHIAIWDVFQRK